MLVGAHLGRGREDGALHEAEHVEGQQLEALGQQHLVGALGLRRAEAAVGAHQLHARMLQLLGAVEQPRVERLLRGDARHQVGARVDVGRLEECRQRVGDRHLHRVHADPPLAARGRVEQRRLQAARRAGGFALLVANLDGEGSVLVDVGQGEQVGAADEEVAVKGRDAHTARGAHAHDRLPPLVAREAPLQVAAELLAHDRVGKARVPVHVARRVLHQLAERRQVGVGAAEVPQVDGHLLLGAVDRHGLVEVDVGLQQRGPLCVPLLVALAVAQLGLTHARPRRVEDVHLAADVLDELVARLERRPEGDLDALVVLMHGGELLEERDQLLLALVHVGEQVLGQRQEDLVDLGHVEHRGRRGGEVVKLQRAVVRDEADLRALAAGQPAASGIGQWSGDERSHR